MSNLDFEYPDGRSPYGKKIPQDEKCTWKMGLPIPGDNEIDIVSLQTGKKWKLR